MHGVLGAEATSWRAQHSAGSVRFCNNRLSACLREDHPNSQKYMVHTGKHSYACCIQDDYTAWC